MPPIVWYYPWLQSYYNANYTVYLFILFICLSTVRRVGSQSPYAALLTALALPWVYCQIDYTFKLVSVYLYCILVYLCAYCYFKLDRRRSRLHIAGYRRWRPPPRPPHHNPHTSRHQWRCIQIPWLRERKILNECGRWVWRQWDEPIDRRLNCAVRCL